MSNPPKPQDLPTLVQLRSELKRIKDDMLDQYYGK